MNFKIIFTTLSFLFLASGIVTVAQEKTTKVNDTISKKYFNALDYSMQKRYRPKNMKFVSEKWSDNTFYELKVGAERFIHRDGAEIGTFKNLVLGYGKLFTSNHGARVNIICDYTKHERAKDSYMRIGMQINHLFNISSYMFGYNPERKFEVSTVSGLGYLFSKIADGNSYHVGNLQTGLQLKLNIMPRLDLVTEPYIGVYTDGVDHYTKTNWHKYDIGYGAAVGLVYRMNGAYEKKNSNDDSNVNDKFVSFGGGIQYQYSKVVREMGIMNTIGPHLNLAFGKWFLPYLGVRLSAFYSYDLWNRYYIFNEENELVGEESLGCTYLGGRLEAMVNVMKIMDLGISRYLAVSPLVGLESGGMIKKDITKNLNYAYYAFTCGMQAKYNINSRWGVFLEPRFTLVPYSYVLKNDEGIQLIDRRSYYDNIYNFNFGVEYSF